MYIASPNSLHYYNIHFVMNLFGSPDSIAYTANKHASGIDTSGVAVLQYPEFIAECVGSKDTAGMNCVLIQGEMRIWFLYYKH